MSWTAGRSATVIGRMRRTGAWTLTRGPPQISTPPSAGASRDAARQRDVLRDEAGEVVGVAGGEARGAGREERGREARVGALAAGDGVGGRPAREVDRDQPLARRAGPGPCRRRGARGARRAASGRGPTGPRAGAGPTARRRPPAASSASPVDDADDRQRQRVREPLRRRDADPQAGERAGAGARRRSPPSAAGATPWSREQRLDPRQQLLAVAIAGDPGARRRSAAPSGAPSATTARVVAVSMARSGPPAVTPRPRGSGA